MSYEEQPDDGLTDEERAALAAGDDDQVPTSEGNDDVDASQQQPEAAAEDQPTGEGEPAADAVATTGADDAQQAAAAEPEQTAPVAKAEPAAPQVAQAPILVVQAPEDAEAKLAEIASKKEALADDYEAGTITLKEMQKQIDALSEQAIDIRMAQREAELAQKLEAQRVQNVWVQDCNNFLAAHAEYKDAERLQQLDETIKALARIPSNAGMSNLDALAKAHRMVRAMNGEPVDDAPKAAAPAPAKVAPPQVKKPEIPPDIGKLPAAAMNDTTGGEFAALESLRKSGNVEAYEDALASLSDAARARYLRA